MTLEQAEKKSDKVVAELESYCKKMGLGTVYYLGVTERLSAIMKAMAQEFSEQVLEWKPEDLEKEKENIRNNIKNKKGAWSE